MSESQANVPAPKTLKQKEREMRELRKVSTQYLGSDAQQSAQEAEYAVARARIFGETAGNDEMHGQTGNLL